MARSVVPVPAFLAGLLALAGCASQAHSQPVTALSLAEQARHTQIVEAPPTDFEMQMKATDTEAPHRFARDKEIASSLHASSPTHTHE
jgi:hypothetical protein